MIDHPDQLTTAHAIAGESGHPPLIFLKIDMGGKRSGVDPQSATASQLISDLLAAENIGSLIFHGLYSHAGQSYSGGSRVASVDYLRQEFEALFVAAEGVTSAQPGKSLVLSVGATPTATAVRNLLVNDYGATQDEMAAISALKGTITAIRDEKHSIEVHAGVYPVLDLQQLATHALSTAVPNPMLGWDDMALTVVGEIASLYPGRGTAGRPEALVAAGSLALGREPCKAYEGWGIVSPWNLQKGKEPENQLEYHEGWQVGRISQEHGILTWSGDEDRATELKVGQKIRIWPNHACIAGACFDWFLVVDSTRKGKEDEVIDVWPRWRGW
jgi:D-serine deaminase-like pyridoxal phosphate-dependent protein